MISVTQLAQAQSLSTKIGISSMKEALGDTSSDSRTIKIEQKSREKPLEIKLSKDQTSLEGIRDAINDADSGISASIVKVKENDYQLVLTADSGVDNKMTISVSGDSKLNDLLAYDHQQRKYETTGGS